MTIPPLEPMAGAAAPMAHPAPSPLLELQGARAVEGLAAPDPGRTRCLPPAGLQASPGPTSALPVPPAASAPGAVSRPLAAAVDQVRSAQARLDRVLALATSGKSFTPAELLGLQARVYRASQELDLASKVVEKGTGGLKQILQTQV